MPFETAALATTAFSDGRTGASVTRIRTGEHDPSFVLKVLPAGTWRDGAIGRTFAGEGALWLDGVPRDLPAPIGCPMLFAQRGKNGESAHADARRVKRDSAARRIQR